MPQPSYLKWSNAIGRYIHEIDAADSHPMPEPTNAPPGSYEKLEVLAARREAGQQLFHRNDRQHRGLSDNLD